MILLLNKNRFETHVSKIGHKNRPIIYTLNVSNQFNAFFSTTSKDSEIEETLDNDVSGIESSSNTKAIEESIDNSNESMITKQHPKSNTNSISDDEFLSDISTGYNSQSSTLDDNSGIGDGVLHYSSDILFSDQSISKLSLFNDNEERDAEEFFNNYVSTNNIYIIPDRDLVHFKDRENALDLVSMNSQLFVNWESWKELYTLYTNSVYAQMFRLKPLNESYMRDLFRSVRSNEVLQDSPVWSLAGLASDKLGQILYGTSHGANELLYYIPTNFSTLSYSYDFSVLSGEGQRRSVDIRLTNGPDTETFSQTYQLLDKIFDPAATSDKFSIIDNKSMFITDSFRSVISDLVSIQDSKTKAVFSQKSTSVRVGTVVKNKNEGASYEDAFSVTAVVNDDVNITISDKNIIDMIFSLFLIADTPYIDNDEYMGIVNNYIGTTLHSYVKDQMMVKEGISLKELKIELSISRITNNSKDLHSNFIRHVNKGFIVPISTLQFMFFDKKMYDVIVEDWSPIIAITALANPSLNEALHSLMPMSTLKDKRNFKSVCRVRSYLNSNTYVSDKPLKWQNDHVCQLSFEEWMKEMAVRSFLKDDYPDYFPLHTRGEWIGPHSESLAINPPVQHKLSKFQVIDVYDIYEDITVKATMRASPGVPEYIRRMTRISKRIPMIFHRLLER
jgi:hypothetical protein